jgi:hypothetical protein
MIKDFGFVERRRHFRRQREQSLLRRRSKGTCFWCMVMPFQKKKGAPPFRALDFQIHIPS